MSIFRGTLHSGHIPSVPIDIGKRSCAAGIRAKYRIVVGREGNNTVFVLSGEIATFCFDNPSVCLQQPPRGSGNTGSNQGLLIAIFTKSVIIYLANVYISTFFFQEDHP